MSKIDEYNYARDWWEQKKKVLNRSIDEMMASENIDKEVLEAMKIILNNNVRIRTKDAEIIN
jgi:hypothetical protein